MTDLFQTSGTSPTDFICEYHGFFLLRPMSPAAFLWIHENLPADRTMVGIAVVVEDIWAIVSGIQDAGMAVSRG